MAAKSKPNEIAITRVYDAPVALVWEAFCDPAQAAQWWGPRGFTLTTHSKELRPGGIWHYTMHGPDGTDYINKALYHEVETHKKLVYDHGGNDEQAPLFRVTVLFIPDGDKTTMEMTMALATAEDAAKTRKFIKEAGGNATWDRLAEYLDEQLAGRDIFVINRTFDAPPDTLFTLWTDPAHLSHWLPPTGFDMHILHGDIRTGDGIFYRMSNHAGITLHGRIDYAEIEPPCRLTYTQRFCDEHGGPGRHPHIPVWPDTMQTTVLFTPEDEAVTRITVTWQPDPQATPAQLEAFRNLRPGMTVGWTGSFDKLEAMLAKQPT